MRQRAEAPETLHVVLGLTAHAHMLCALYKCIQVLNVLMKIQIKPSNVSNCLQGL